MLPLRVCVRVWEGVCVCWLRLRAAVLFMNRSQPASLKRCTEPLSWTAATAVSELSTRCAHRLIWQHRASPNPSLYRNLFILHSKRISTKKYTRSDVGNGQKISEDAFLPPPPPFFSCFVSFKKKIIVGFLGSQSAARGMGERNYIFWLILILLLCKHQNVPFPLGWYSHTAEPAAAKWHLSLPLVHLLTRS